MTTRLADARDESAIAALDAEIFGTEAWSRQQVADELATPMHVVVVAEQDGAVVGYGCISVAGDVADLLRIAVTPEARRSGIASGLLSALTDRAVGAERMLLEVASANRGARDFYAAHGYAEISRRQRYYATGEDAIVMARQLR